MSLRPQRSKLLNQTNLLFTLSYLDWMMYRYLKKLFKFYTITRRPKKMFPQHDRSPEIRKSIGQGDGPLCKRPSEYILTTLNSLTNKLVFRGAILNDNLRFLFIFLLHGLLFLWGSRFTLLFP